MYKFNYSKFVYKPLRCLNRAAPQRLLRVVPQALALPLSFFPPWTRCFLDRLGQLRQLQAE
jgi:hypothetical protein